MNTDRYYQLTFIRIKDPARFALFLDRAGPAVAASGHGLARMLAPETLHADGISRPDIVNVVYYDSKAALARFEADPLTELRAEAIDLVSVEGRRIGPPVAPSSDGGRLYLIEVVRFGGGGAKAYLAYERQAEPVMARYGYHVEHVIQADSSRGLPFVPDLVKVAYFDTPAGLARFHADPAHARIEREAYPAATERSLWLTAREHPSANNFRSVTR
jgi:hypothetical protein